MPEEDELLPDSNRPLAHADLDKPDRRPGRPAEQGFRPGIEVRTGLDLHLPGGEFHREGKAGGIPTLLAVRLREKFVDLERLHRRFTSRTSRSFFTDRGWRTQTIDAPATNAE